MMHHKRAIMAGSYDPFQRGHTWLVTQALKIAETVAIVISYNADKKGSTFSLEERKQLIGMVINCDIPIKDHSRITVEVVQDEILAMYARRTGASLLVRGLRNDLDFRYEHDILDINRIAAPEIETVFMMPPSELTLASSTMVKGLLKFNGGRLIAERFAHACVVDAIERKINETTSN